MESSKSVGLSDSNKLYLQATRVLNCVEKILKDVGDVRLDFTPGQVAVHLESPKIGKKVITISQIGGDCITMDGDLQIFKEKDWTALSNTIQNHFLSLI